LAPSSTESELEEACAASKSKAVETTSSLATSITESEEDSPRASCLLFTSVYLELGRTGTEPKRRRKSSGQSTANMTSDSFPPESTQETLFAQSSEDSSGEPWRMKRAGKATIARLAEHRLQLEACGRMTKIASSVTISPLRRLLG
jgi:hypothetical protein